MRWSLRVGTIAGIRVELHVTFLLFVGGLAVVRGAMTSVERAISEVSLILLIFFCVLLHELGHALTARRFGIRTLDIILLPIGGVARLQRMPEKPKQELLVAVAGPAVNVAIVLVLLGLIAILGRSLTGLELRGGLIETLVYVNVVMVIFNMIPAFPMDGGRVLRALLAMRLPYVRATRIASFMGQGIALIFGFIGLFSGTIMLMLIALFVFLAASEERALVETRASLAGIPVHAAMLTEFHSIEAGDPIQRAVDLLVASSQQDFPVIQGTVPIGILTRADLARALQTHGASVAVGEVVVRDENFAEANEPLEAALQRMRERGRSALPVLRGGALVGLITVENVSDVLIVRGALERYSGGRRG